MNVVGESESERRRRRETRNKKKQGPGVFHQVPIATPVHVGKFERQQFILRINLGGIGSALVCTHSNRPSPPMLPHLKCLSHSPSSLSLILSSSSSFVCIHHSSIHPSPQICIHCILLLPPLVHHGTTVHLLALKIP